MAAAYHTTARFTPTAQLTPASPGLTTMGAAATPAAAGLGAATELDAELQALRAARSEYQRSITASHDARSGLLGTLDRTEVSCV